MPTLTNQSMQTWNISYDPYSDLFQIFKSEVMKTSNKDLEKKKKGYAVLFYDKKTKRPVMVEFKHAYEYLGDIDNMTKEDIIQSVIGYVKHHG